MPKMKTSKAAAKRFKVTASGKIRRGRAYATHLLAGKRPKRKRRFRQSASVHPADMARVRGLLPYR